MEKLVGYSVKEVTQLAVYLMDDDVREDLLQRNQERLKNKKHIRMQAFRTPTRYR